MFQSIGMKEFLPFLKLPPEERENPDFEPSNRLFAAGVERLKISTRQYARRQRNWVKNRMVERVERMVSGFFRDFKTFGSVKKFDFYRR